MSTTLVDYHLEAHLELRAGGLTDIAIARLRELIADSMEPEQRLCGKSDVELTANYVETEPTPDGNTRLVVEYYPARINGCDAHDIEEHIKSIDPLCARPGFVYVYDESLVESYPYENSTTHDGFYVGGSEEEKEQARSARHLSIALTLSKLMTPADRTRLAAAVAA